MNRIQHPSNNHVLAPPPGMTPEECVALPVTRTVINGHRAFVSFWQPDAEELALIAQGKPLALVVFGNSHPVVGLAVDSTK